jgi:hypothetical protein
VFLLFEIGIVWRCLYWDFLFLFLIKYEKEMISPMISLPLFEAQPKNKWGEKSCTHGLDP